MSDKLKKFINEHRLEFDSEEPPAHLWNKIDARMDLKNSSLVKSKWLFNSKFLGFSAVVFALALFFISKNLRNDIETKGVPHAKISARGAKFPELKEKEKITSKAQQEISNHQTKFSNSSNPKHWHSVSIRPAAVSGVKDSISNSNFLITSKSEPQHLYSDSIETTNNPGTYKKEHTPAKSNKKQKLQLPVEPEEINTFTGTLYEGPSFRAMLRAYKFPGKFNIDEGGFKIISCSHLEKVPNIKAIWIKGRTDKELILSVKRKFKNVILVKKDGRELKPEAISHYYRGLGVMSEFRGRAFNMLFKDKVELILFFKDAEEGDKIIIDGILKAIVKSHP